ncbi:hypothetical protein M758_12G036800 [Ceratodon purpureus]|nr:hypothetical protein M758_12G036800 [Ceratodon purpureus]
MSAPRPVTREDETDDVYMLSSSSANSDEPREGEEVGKRGSPPGSPREEGYLQKKQKLMEAVGDQRLNGWRHEDMKNEAPTDLNIGHEASSASPVALVPFFPQPSREESGSAQRICKQFWKAGDYEGHATVEVQSADGIDRVRVHPKFLHTNATSHRWALGAVAELVDNAMDEVLNGATFVNVDVRLHPQNGSAMLLIEDDGGGMDPDRLRQCLSFGYSEKSKSANTIGQYGNGFKTSTMRLGADVIVFTRSRGSNGDSCTQSIGMLSFTFLRESGLFDIVVPMIDYEIGGTKVWKQIRRSSEEWAHSLETIRTWSPYGSEDDLFDQFAGMKDHGTRIVLYNLWEDDQGQLELDFDTDPYDIQIRGANRDEKKIAMAQRFPNSSHFLTYRHSLRSYVSILYLRMPAGFKIILRGEEVRHHNLVDDLMYTQERTYRPQSRADHVANETNMVANVILGFVKDARDHVNVQGFNVYHKNRLIKPFWKIWNSTGSDGRGIIGVLEANFVEPAHDKQGFEHTIVLSRLESRLLQMQKDYWINNCHKVGYVSRRNKSSSVSTAPLPGAGVLNRGQGSRMSSRVSDAHAELRLSLPSNLSSEGRRGGGVLQTYGEVASGSLRLETEPAAAISGSGSLTNGTSTSKQGNEPGFKEVAPTIETLEELGRMALSLHQRIKKEVEEIHRLRDILQIEAEVDRLFRENVEKDIKKQKTEALLLVRELEAENLRLQLRVPFARVEVLKEEVGANTDMRPMDDDADAGMTEVGAANPIFAPQTQD